MVPSHGSGSALKSISVVVTCMGRLAHLRTTVPAVLRCPGLRYCLVDFSCPDGCGAWMERYRAAECRARRVVIESIVGQRSFNKSAALNAGARRAIAEGAEYLCFLDADTVAGPEFFDWIAPRVAPGRFLIAGLENGCDVQSLQGILVMAAADFAKTQGFDEEFEGWGGEDIEFRLRLHIVHGLCYADIPPALLTPLEHDDDLRSRFYEVKDLRSSELRNRRRTQEKVRTWTLHRPTPRRAIERLMYQAPAGPRAAR